MEEWKNQQENGTIDSLGPPHNKILQGPPIKNKGHGEQYNTIILKPAIIRPLPSSPYRLVTHGQRIGRNFHLYMNMPWIAWQFAKSQPGGTPFQGDGNINTYTKQERGESGRERKRLMTHVCLSTNITSSSFSSMVWSYDSHYTCHSNSPNVIITSSCLARWQARWSIDLVVESNLRGFESTFSGAIVSPAVSK